MIPYLTLYTYTVMPPLIHRLFCCIMDEEIALCSKYTKKVNTRFATGGHFSKNYWGKHTRDVCFWQHTYCTVTLKMHPSYPRYRHDGPKHRGHLAVKQAHLPVYNINVWGHVSKDHINLIFCPVRDINTFCRWVKEMLNQIIIVSL